MQQDAEGEQAGFGFVEVAHGLPLGKVVAQGVGQAGLPDVFEVVLLLPCFVGSFEPAAGGGGVVGVFFVEPVFCADEAGDFAALEAVAADELVLPVERVEDVPCPLLEQGVECVLHIGMTDWGLMGKGADYSEFGAFRLPLRCLKAA